MTTEKSEMSEMKSKKGKLINDLYTLGEEVFNSVSHGVAALLAVLGLVLVIVFAVIYGDAWVVTGVSIYGATLFLLFLMSTLYHSINVKSAKKIFRKLDHSAIFLLIAGTYTPFCLVTLRGAWGWTIFGLVWGSAIIGVILNSINVKKYAKFSIICYVASGWSVIIAIYPLINSLHPVGLALLASGGVAYTFGITFYKLKKKYMHGVWHLFVLSGSVLQYFAVLLYVVPVMG
jgi:hemolysin III